MFYMCLTHKCGFGVNSYASISKGRTQDVTAHGVNSEQLLFPVERLQTSLFFRSVWYETKNFSQCLQRQLCSLYTLEQMHIHFFKQLFNSCEKLHFNLLMFLFSHDAYLHARVLRNHTKICRCTLQDQVASPVVTGAPGAGAKTPPVKQSTQVITTGTNIHT